MAGEELPIPNLAVFHRMVRIGLRSFALCCKLKSTWILLKPHVDSLVANFALPQLTFNVSKQAMCEADPVEYVRASVGEFTVFLLLSMSVSHMPKTSTNTSRPP
jgi:hypothetical protein